MEDARKAFTGDAGYDEYCRVKGIKTNDSASADEIVDIKSQVQSFRAEGEAEEEKWAKGHPLSELGYEARNEKFGISDGKEIDVKIYQPQSSSASQLPLLFMIHGGGFFMGSPASEDSWFVYHLLRHNSAVVVSPDYRLAPEHAYPTGINDCWDILQTVLGQSETLRFDRNKVVLAGTSAGGCIAAVLSQRARDASVKVHGVILNVPVLCDYRYWPRDKYGPNAAYEQSKGDMMLSAGEMRGTWTMVIPEGEGGNAQASPLLGNVEGVPQHVVFVAGKDPLRDEAVAYVQKLREAGIKVESFLYPGVPHQFATIWELGVTSKFRDDLNGAWRELMGEV